ncbi:REP-associated tyrosine transposase [Pseudaestuariivita sp.]|uniref:REP-associated tyrosine transposase n=1 Tax=Pseudaestuariivita sp. TaxID=2211669 RepID=UPI0040595E44
MTSYRRRFVPGGTYFFTVALAERGSGALVAHIDALRVAWAQTVTERPFHTDAICVLPDHLHAIWTLPEGDADFSTRWRLIKSRMSRAVAAPCARHRSGRLKQERAFWQRRFWEHVIRDGEDLARHRRYIWQNPVRHGLVRDVWDWPHSSIHRDRPEIKEPLEADLPLHGAPFWTDEVGGQPGLLQQEKIARRMGARTHPPQANCSRINRSSSP